MKHKTAKPSELGMRFFTPELYRRFNSTDDNVADLANHEWDHAIAEYRKRIDHLLAILPTPVKKLADLTLHDAEVIARFEGEQQSTPHWTAVSFMILRHDGKLLVLVYWLWDKVEENEAPSGWPFAATNVHWLYDEIDAVIEPHPLFVHRILLSDGRIIHIPFLNVQLHQIPANESVGKA